MELMYIVIVCFNIVCRFGIIEAQEGPAENFYGNAAAAQYNRRYKYKNDIDFNENSYVVPNAAEQPMRQTIGNNSLETVCHLHPKDENLYLEVNKLRQEDVKLIQYTFSFPEYDFGTLQIGTGNNYKSDVWQRVFDEHGRTLLALKFNYDVLSLGLLNFGVEKMDVSVIDAPPRCFGMISPEARFREMKRLILADMRIHVDGTLALDKGDQACHYIIKNETDDGRAGFHYECCDEKVCSDKHEQEWLKFLMILIALLKLVVLMCGPLILIHWSFYDSLKVTDYVVFLKQSTRKTMLVKKIRMADGSPPETRQKDMKQLQKFRKLLKVIPSERLLHVVFNKLHITVDQRHLMTQSAVPVGFFRFFYESILCCGFTMWEPFQSCCSESLMGSWNQKFLWFKLKAKGDDCNNSCRKFFSWKHILRVFGGLLIIAMLLLPYYGRVIVYYAYEHDELEERREAVEELGLKWPFQFSLIHFLDPSHEALIMMYAISGASFVLLALLRACSVHTFDEIVLQAFQDLRQVKRLECVRMLLAHVILPFEKFGVCGIVVAVVYWPIMLPLSVLIAVIYCIPTTYLMCRFIIHKRPGFLKNWPLPTHKHRREYPGGVRTLSAGVSSFESCFMLDNIQGGEEEDELLDTSSQKEAQTQEKRKWFRMCFTRQQLGVCMLKLVMGILSIALLFSIILMLTESFGFILEVLVFTLMGGLVNASSATQYVLLSFWFLLYANVCYKRVYDRYLKLSEHLFDFMQKYMDEEIKKGTFLRGHKKRNTAYKYYSEDELQHMEQEELNNQYIDSDVTHTTAVPIYTPKPHETVERKGSKLYWRVNDVVMFVDQYDIARIPIELFRRVCDIEAPGCPGPLYKSYVKATKHLCFMLLFLLFVLGIVMSFGATYDISSTNQLLLILSAGFLPFIIRYMFLSRSNKQSDLTSYTFGGKVQEVIRRFNQVWPVYDFSFRLATPEELDQMQSLDVTAGYTSIDGVPASRSDGSHTDQHVTFRNPSDAAQPSLPLPDPDSVDLYINIRDDQDSERDNIRGETSHGQTDSRLSLNSLLNRTSPPYEEDEQQLLSNRPSNLGNAPTLPLASRQNHNMHESNVLNRDADDDGDRASVTSNSSNASSVRPKELMMDMSRGSVVRGAEGEERKQENGVPVWQRQSPLNSYNESESKL